MTRLIAPVLLIITALVGVLSSCGKEGSAPPPPVITERKPTILIMYGAGFCGECKQKFPEIYSALSKLSKPAKDHLTVDLFLTAGDPPAVKPTYEMAEAYMKLYYPGAIAFADVNWLNFKNMLPGVKLAVPAAVVADENGSIVKRYQAGSTTFVPSEIVSYVKGRIGE